MSKRKKSNVSIVADAPKPTNEWQISLDNLYSPPTDDLGDEGRALVTILRTLNAIDDFLYQHGDIDPGLRKARASLRGVITHVQRAVVEVASTNEPKPSMGLSPGDPIDQGRCTIEEAVAEMLEDQDSVDQLAEVIRSFGPFLTGDVIFRALAQTFESLTVEDRRHEVLEAANVQFK